jgi:hypothetical protein
MGDATAFTLKGPARLLYGPAGAEVEFGKTFETPVVVRIQEISSPIMFHQTGMNPWDAITIGKLIEVEASFANLSWQLLMNALPDEATLCDDVTTPTAAPGDQSLEILVGLGTSHRDAAQRLILQPYYNGIPDPNVETWFYFPLAYPVVDAEINHDYESQKVLHVKFEVFPVSQACPRLMFMGNEAYLCAC